MNDIQRGQRAKEILADPLIKEALTGIEDIILDEWKTQADPSMREELWHTYKGMNRFKTALEIAVTNGEYEVIMKEKENGV